MTDVRTSGEVRRLAPVDLVVLAASCGLAAGELEVAARFLHRTVGSTHQFFLMTRHFVWLIPLFDLALFLAAGAMLALAARRWPRRAGWLDGAAGAPELLTTSVIPEPRFSRRPPGVPGRASGGRRRRRTRRGRLA